MGRSYGDVGLNAGGTAWLTTALDRFIAFDAATGVLTCEPGVILGDIQRLFVQRGWMLPVSPGTQFVTVGGAIANDVHGKNHHVAGSFGDHVAGLRLVRTDGEVIDCGPDLRPDWFAATVGGMGLTGVISAAQLRLQRVAGPWLETESIAFDHVDAFFPLADDSESGWANTVSWIDCVAGRDGRGLFNRANPSPRTDPVTVRGGQLTMPFVPPFSLVNTLSLRAFNTLYYYRGKAGAGRKEAHYQPFLYPLDGIAHWNRMYGPRGFYQYQCVVPRAVGRNATHAMLDAIGRAGAGSFLTVLKTFGDRKPVGMMSFAQPGVTLAVDFPNYGKRTLALLDRLDAIVREAGGRLYPAKDARMPRDMFESGYPRLSEFLAYRDPGISSEMSRRLMGY
jgi:FAD/FMN-containing dehydrogenase